MLFICFEWTTSAVLDRCHQPVVVMKWMARWCNCTCQWKVLIHMNAGLCGLALLILWVHCKFRLFTRLLLLSRCVINSAIIDEINILQATLRAMEGAVANLSGLTPDFILVDGSKLPAAFDPQRSKAIVGGDATCLSISAASVIAKVKPFLRKWWKSS